MRTVIKEKYLKCCLLCSEIALWLFKGIFMWADLVWSVWCLSWNLKWQKVLGNINLIPQIYNLRDVSGFTRMPYDKFAPPKPKGISCLFEWNFELSFCRQKLEILFTTETKILRRLRRPSEMTATKMKRRWVPSYFCFCCLVKERHHSTMTENVF